MADYYDTLADKAQDFILMSEKQAVQESVDNFEDVIEVRLSVAIENRW